MRQPKYIFPLVNWALFQKNPLVKMGNTLHFFGQIRLLVRVLD